MSKFAQATTAKAMAAAVPLGLLWLSHSHNCSCCFGLCLIITCSCTCTYISVETVQYQVLAYWDWDQGKPGRKPVLDYSWSKSLLPQTHNVITQQRARFLLWIHHDWQLSVPVLLNLKIEPMVVNAFCCWNLLISVRPNDRDALCWCNWSTSLGRSWSSMYLHVNVHPFYIFSKRQPSFIYICKLFWLSHLLLLTTAMSQLLLLPVYNNCMHSTAT